MAGNLNVSPLPNPVADQVAPQLPPPAVPPSAADLAPPPAVPVVPPPSGTPSEGAPQGATAPVINASAIPAQIPMLTTSEKQTKHESAGAKLRPEDVKKMQEAEDRYAKAEAAVVDAQTAQNNLEAGLKMAEAARLEDENAKEVARKDLQQKQIQDKLNQVQAAIDDFSNTTIDPGRLYGNMSTGTRIASGIALALGAFGAAASGGQNMAMQVIDKAIERDIDAQKANLDTKKSVITAKRGMYDDFMKMLGNEDAAKLAEEIRLGKIAESRIKGILETSKNPIIQANAEKMLAERQASTAQKVAELQKVTTSDQVLKQSETKPLIAKSADRPPATDAINTKITSHASQIKNLNELRDFMNSGKTKSGPIAGRWTDLADYFGIANASEATATARIRELLADKIRALSGASTTESEREFLKGLMPALKDSPAAFMAKLNNQLNKTERDYDDMYKQFGNMYTLPERIVETRAEKSAKEKSLGIER